MTPVPYTDGPRRRQETAVTHTCPDCPGQLTRQHGSLVCSDCGYVPRHGAD